MCIKLLFGELSQTFPLRLRLTWNHHSVITKVSIQKLPVASILDHASQLNSPPLLHGMNSNPLFVQYQLYSTTQQQTLLWRITDTCCCIERFWRGTNKSLLSL